jgi:hypothetical protein
MCTNPSHDFSNLTIEKFFECCDSLNSSRIPMSNTLIIYLAWSSNKNFNSDECLIQLYSRNSIATSALGYHDWEEKIFNRRFKLLSSNNKAYEIATRPNPTVSDLEEYSQIDPCFATLYPIKQYLSNHIEMSVGYRGMLPFGREVVRYYNTIVPTDLRVKGSPTFRDHVSLRNISNRKAILMGVPTLTINNLMYQFGRMMSSSDVSYRGLTYGDLMSKWTY